MVRKILPSREEIRKLENDPKRIAEREAWLEKTKDIKDTRTTAQKIKAYGNREKYLKDPGKYYIINGELVLQKDYKKSTTKKDIEKKIKEVTGTKFKDYKDNTKIINDIVNLVSDIYKTSKMKKIDTEDIQHQLNEVEKLLKSKPKALKKLVKADKEHLKYHPSKMDNEELKLDTKIMKQSKDYTHKVKNVSQAVKNYVDQYFDIYKNSKTPQSRDKKLNDLKLNVYTNLKPSDIDDANTLIGEFKKTLDPIVKTKAKPKQSSPEDKKYKSVTAYVKKNKPSITNKEEIHIITTYLIDKNQRMSKKLLDEILKDLEY